MPPPPDRASDQRLLDALQGFVAMHPHPDVGHFRAALAGWGTGWQGVSPHHLPAADTLAAALPHCSAETRELVALAAQERARRCWEQSYTRADGLVGEDMLAGYGFAEVVGKNGPFVSSRVRCGFGVWGPEIDYPPHRHQAEEIYVLLAGSAEFRLGEARAVEVATRRAGEVVRVTSRQRHGFRTLRDPLVVLYIWQNGALRETSHFG